MLDKEDRERRRREYQREYSKTWKSRNPEYLKRWRAANPEKANKRKPATPEQRARDRAWHAEWKRKRYEANPELREADRLRTVANARARRERNPNADRLRKRGLSDQEFRDMMELQGYQCAVCPTPMTLRGGHIDHDHATGFVRGVLCRQCNHTLGHAGDDPDRLEMLATYLRLTKKRSITGVPHRNVIP